MGTTDLRTKTKYAGQLVGHLARHPGDLKLLPQWRRYLKPSPLVSRVPWLPFAAIDNLATYVTPESRVFEFGGGGSTAWFADRGASVTTAEHDPEWAQMIRDAVPQVDLRRVDGPDYPAAIDDDAPYDIVLVDGEQRVECVRHGMAKVGRGGVLVLDDANVPQHGQAFDLLIEWPYEIFEGLAPGKAIPGLTAFFRRP